MMHEAAMHETMAPPRARRLTWADAGVAAVLGLCLLSIPVLVAFDAPPLALLAAPGLLLGLATGWVLLRHPLANLVVVLALSVFTIGYEKGVQIEEVVYGLYYLGYLAGWFGLRMVVLREPVARNSGERALLIFLVAVFALTPVWFLLGADFGQYQSEAVALANLAFFFPVREAIERDRRALLLIVGVVLWIPVFIAVRNLINYRELIAQVVVADVLTGRRVSVNDLVLMVGAVFSTGLASAVRSRVAVAALIGVIALCGAALAVTQSRAMWVMVVFGAVLTFGLGRAVQRRRVVVGGVLVVGLVGLAAIVLLGDELAVIAGAFLERLLTVRTAATSDISFMSRLYEARGALAYVRKNPILGYGLGNNYTYFDIILQNTLTRGFMHNGYVGLVFHFGIWGPPLVITFWVHAIREGLRAHWRGAAADPLAAAAGLSASLVLIAFVASTITANPFYNSDSLLVFGLMGGVACGAYARVRRRADALAAASQPPPPREAPP